MNLRKIVTVSASALLLLSVGASASTCTTSNASASRVSRLEARKSRDYRDIRSINAQLVKLQHHNKRGHRHNVRRSRKRVTRKHNRRNRSKSSLSGGMPNKLLGSSKDLNNPEWYVKDSRKIINHYNFHLNNINDEFVNGVEDANNWGNVQRPNKHFNAYKEGWVYSETGIFDRNGDYDPNIGDKLYFPSKQKYSKALKQFNRGLRLTYIKRGPVFMRGYQNK